MQKRTSLVESGIVERAESHPPILALSRRQSLIAVTAFAAAGAVGAPALAQPPPNSRARATIRAICFDLFTLFDPRGVMRAADALVPGRGAELWNAWKVRQFEYSWLRTAAGRYADFESVTAEALTYAANERNVSLSPDAKRSLVDAYSTLEPWPDTRSALAEWKKAGLKLAPLSNYSPKMLERLLAQSGLKEAFDTQISTHAVQSFKPDPRAYALGPAALGLPREAIAFAAFGGWDAAGSKWFGFPTFWVNRLGVTAEALIAPDATGPNLAPLAKWVLGR